MTKTLLGNDPNQEKIPCSKCGRKFTAPLWRNINAASQPELKKLCLNGSLMKFKCPHCHNIFILEYSLLYLDSDNKFIAAAISKPLLHYSDDYFKTAFGDFPSCTPDFRKRVVLRMRTFSETVRVFEYGLDDRVIQLMKFFIELDYEDQDKPLPAEIVFSGISTNFNRTELQFDVLTDGKHESLRRSEKEYQFCARLHDQYSSAYHEDDWLAVDKYFSNSFLDTAYKIYKKEESEIQNANSTALKKRICENVPKNKVNLVALINVSYVNFDGVTIIFEFRSEVLTEKMEQQMNDLSKILEQTIGFAPDIVIRTIRRPQKKIVKLKP